MALNIQSRLFARTASSSSHNGPLRVYNRSPEKTAPLVAAGSIALNSPAALAQQCSIVHVMMANDAAVLETITALLATPRPATLPQLVVLNHATVSPTCARTAHAMCTAKGAIFVPCPVMGRPERAKEAKLGAIVSGLDKAVLARVEPSIRCFSENVTDVGADIGAANAFKLVLNYHLPVGMEMITEAMCLMDKNGIDRKHLLAFYPFILSIALPGYASVIASSSFHQGMSVANGIKDVDLILGLGRDSGVKLKYAEVARERLVKALERGRGDLDWAVMATVIREENGVETGLKGKL
ncbi:6-phosphogluconate dehydrogenase C-terminal domain-like protein [Gonapodya prolifera JEL478]|uniref:6-phosphogluconate dehydrogenase C-terminal domain-like protein n=1 Tax=Gonapodya prolifera (strain JEL478) TaxID=1344416 RepID=A0A139A0X4_GONPJ|nr:6-phosphogluconate dehydrogenase C-terminal domain-like protein [Gonapodya prolifera JEL478]|eukprot:KXS10374.1 6-phosphogluconate dehydrogenase C-terminal domain-like protein [Gonapodya prolifera JEL478]